MLLSVHAGSALRNAAGIDRIIRILEGADRAISGPEARVRERSAAAMGGAAGDQTRTSIRPTRRPLT
ncbi:MAG: hypothetical protein ACK56N_00850, partial [Betaproteobacteria bacterium]